MKSLAVALSFLSFICFSAQSQAQMLEWKLKKGQVFTVESINEMVSSMKLPDGSTQEMPMKQQFDSEWKITDSDAKSFSVQTTIKRMRTSMKSPFMNVDYDSDKEEPKDPFGKQIATSMKPLLGSEFAMVIGRRGNLIEMKVPEFVDKTPANALTGDSLKESFWQQVEFPEGEMKPGREWEQTLKSNMNGMQTKLQVKFRNDGLVEEQGRKFVKIHSEFSTELVQAPPGIQMTLEDVGSEGEVLFDVELGCVSKQVQKQKYKMNMSVGGEKISQEIDGSTTTIFRLAN